MWSLTLFFLNETKGLNKKYNVWMSLFILYEYYYYYYFNFTETGDKYIHEHVENLTDEIQFNEKNCMFN